MHMSMPACAHAQVCPCTGVPMQPTATAISSSHPTTKLPFQREVSSRFPKSHSSSGDTDLLSELTFLGTTSPDPGSLCAHDIGRIPPTPCKPWDDSTLWVPGLETFLSVSSSSFLPPAWRAWLPHTLPSSAFLCSVTIQFLPRAFSIVPALLAPSHT